MKTSFRCGFLLSVMLGSVLAGVHPAKADCDKSVNLPLLLRLSYGRQWELVTVRGELLPDESSVNLIDDKSKKEYTFWSAVEPLPKYRHRHVQITGCVGSFHLVPWGHHRQFFQVDSLELIE